MNQCTKAARDLVNKQNRVRAVFRSWPFSVSNENPSPEEVIEFVAPTSDVEQLMIRNQQLEAQLQLLMQREQQRQQWQTKEQAQRNELFKP